MKIETIEDLKRYLIKQFPDANIFLFGSRARGDASKASDIDIAIEATDIIDRKKLAQIRYELEESGLIYNVDLVDLKKTPYLREIIKKEGIIWHSKNS